MIRTMLALVVALVGVQAGALTVVAEPSEQQTQARIIKRHGAGIREESTPESLILIMARCNESYLMLGTNGPWRQVFSVVGRPDEQTVDEFDDIFGWVHVDHIAIGPNPAPVDCGAAQTYAAGETVESYTDEECLALRQAAGGDALVSECRTDGVHYEVVSGPSVVSGEEWFELRPRDGGANGWARGRILVSVP